MEWSTHGDPEPLCLLAPGNDEPVNYLQKSRNQKTGAWVLLGLGVAGIISGIVIEANNVVENLR
jgi:hypothetical protein